jgi:hypothetical protein
MRAHDTIEIEIATGLAEVSKAEWDGLANPAHRAFDPFMSWDFLEALEASGCASVEKGWAPRHILARQDGRLVGAAPAYLKSHSYGEYVFDHSWADALHRIGGRYYPKMQIAAPFTPAPGRRFLTENETVRAALFEGAILGAQHLSASSAHATFLTAEEAEAAAQCGFMRRIGVQYHWDNAGYRNFDDFLAALSSAKRKNIRKERARACESLEVRTLRGSEIKPDDWDFFFRCYMDTGARKWGNPYLNRAFFNLLSARLGERCLLFVAHQDGRAIAAALNLIGGEALYGRYWGAITHVPFLHFELCYYRAIDYAIAHGLARVEAGAQGEHKLLRGYSPTPTYSVHWIAHTGLRDAVGRFLASETPAMVQEIEHLEAYTPYKDAN